MAPAPRETQSNRVLPFCQSRIITDGVKTITFKADKRLTSLLEKEARTRRVAKGQVIREALEARFEGRSGKSCYDFTSDLCGSFSSGLRDLSTNKRHLKGFGRS
jgi:hypothetical protein